MQRHFKYVDNMCFESQSTEKSLTLLNLRKSAILFLLNAFPIEVTFNYNIKVFDYVVFHAISSRCIQKVKLKKTYA